MKELYAIAKFIPQAHVRKYNQSWFCLLEEIFSVSSFCLVPMSKTLLLSWEH